MFFATSTVFPQTETFESVAFRAMKDEMDRNLSALKLDKLQSPYYIGYTITDAKIYSTEAQLGALVNTTDAPRRTQSVSVLVGDNQRNNLNFVNEDNMFGNSGSSFYIPMTMENDYDAIRRALWVSTDARYKSAAELFEAKIATIKQQNLPKEELDLPDCVAVPPLDKSIQAPEMKFDKALVERHAKDLSAVFTNYPNFTNSSVTMYVYTADALYLNNEGIKYKVPFSLICVNVQASATAADGEPLSDHLDIYARSFEQLPTFETLKKRVEEMAANFEKLREAPAISESYSGPVMFEGEVVGEIIERCFVNNANGLLASRKSVVGFTDPWMLSRYGGSIPKENTLEQMTGKKVISREFSVTALHDQQVYNGQPLLGYYEFDAQGVVPAPRVELIKDGVLKALLTDRVPTMKNTTSTGNSVLMLSGGSLHASLSSGVLEFTSTVTKSDTALKNALIAAAKEEDYEYAYIVRKMSKTSNVLPVLIYRISVKDGKEELLRSAKLSDLTLKSFKRVIGVSDTQIVFNTLNRGRRGYRPQGGAPASFIVPNAIVFQELEIEKNKDIVLKKETISPSPLVAK